MPVKRLRYWNMDVRLSSTAVVLMLPASPAKSLADEAHQCDKPQALFPDKSADQLVVPKHFCKRCTKGNSKSLRSSSGIATGHGYEDFVVVVARVCC